MTWDAPLSDFSLPADVVLMKLGEDGDMEWSDTLGSPSIPSGSFRVGCYVDAAIDDEMPAAWSRYEHWNDHVSPTMALTFSCG